jgi:hypothetical protein
MCELSKHYYSCTVTSSLILEHYSVLVCSVVFYTSCVFMLHFPEDLPHCLLFHKHVQRHHITTSITCIDHSHYFWKEFLHSFCPLTDISKLTQNYSIYSQLQKPSFKFTALNIYVALKSWSVHITQCLSRIYTTSFLQNKCVAGVCWCCRRLGQLCHEYSLAHLSNWLRLTENFLIYIAY